MQLPCSHYPLSLIVHPGNELKVCFNYDSSQFRKWQICQLAQHFETLLTALTRDLSVPVKQVSMLCETEYKKLIKWSDGGTPRLHKNSVLQLFEQHAEHNPDQIAITFERRQLTYSEVNKKANQLARYLLNQSGEPSAPIGILLGRSPEQIIAALAIQKSGRAYVPIDSKLPDKRVQFILEDASIKKLVTHSEYKIQHGLFDSLCITIDNPETQLQLNQQKSTNLNFTIEKENNAYIIYTSGSTGNPKAALLTHGGLVNFVEAVSDVLHIDERSRLLQFSSFSFDVAVFEWATALSSGAALVMIPQEIVLSPDCLTQTVNSENVSHALLPPTLLHHLDPIEWQGVSTIVTGGESFSISLVESWSRGRSFYNTYGTTETTILSTLFRFQEQENKMSIGRPFAGVKTYVLDDNLKPVPVGVVGEIFIGGPGVARGYLNRPDLTEERYLSVAVDDSNVERLYRTGDHARWTPHGELEFIGRKDSQVKIRGHRIELEEISENLLKHCAIKDALTIVRRNKEKEAELIAYIIVSDDLGDLALWQDTFREWLLDRLPGYMIPNFWVFLEKWPLNINGKIDRKALPEPAMNETKRQQEVYSFTENEMMLLWQGLLGHKLPISRDDDFFKIGGHSLLAVRLVALIEQKWNKKIPIASLMKYSTLSQLSRLVEHTNDGSKDAWSPLVILNEAPSKETLFIIPGAGGLSVAYLALSQTLTSDYSIVVLESKGLDGSEEPHSNMDDLVDCYHKALLKYQTKGPFFLVGHSFGARVSFELGKV